MAIYELNPFAEQEEPKRNEFVNQKVDLSKFVKILTNPSEEPTPLDWGDQSACLGSDSNVFFPKRGESVEPAKKICDKCEVIRFCLRDHIVDQVGIFGGTSEGQRRKLRRELGVIAMTYPDFIPEKQPDYYENLDM